MKKNIFIPFLLAITTITYGSPLESLSQKSPANLLLEEYCTSFTNTSIRDVTPFVEFIKLIPDTDLQFAVATLKSNEKRDLFSPKSAFGLLQVLFTELQPRENKTLVLTDLKSQDCGICYESKVEQFFEVCGFGVCEKCLGKVNAHCPSCRKYHHYAYEVALYQLDKSHYPFVAVLPSPKKLDLNESIKKVYSSLIAWIDLINNQPFSEDSSVAARVDHSFEEILTVQQTKATIKILQIFDILQHRTLWEFKEPIFILKSSITMLLKMLSKANPDSVEKSLMSDKEAAESEVMNQTFSEMENSFSELFYYIQWFINTLVRQCYHVSNEPVPISKDNFEILENFMKDSELYQ